jgi:predicted ATPase/DNA-binding SARP family transcriptional activator/DNA-binding CsgD family transcriptional regulator
MHDPRGPPEGGWEAVRVWLLGGFRVTVGHRLIEEGEWRLRKAAGLIKLLALSPGHRIHREQAMDLLWPNLGRRAASNNLRQTLHAARRILSPVEGSCYLASTDESIVLCPEGRLWVDVEAFEDAAATARRARDPTTYRAAIDLYAGDLLPEDRYEEWTAGRRQELRRLYLSLLVELAGLYEERGEDDSAVEVLRGAVKEEPILEEAHASLMRLYTLSSRRGQALAQYEQLRETLYRELSIEPSATTRYVRDEIVAGRFPWTNTESAGSSSEEPLEAGRHNLPDPRTSFVGREREIIEVKRILMMTRLLTLTGVGGSGKTRLALEVAKELVRSYPDGVWLVELAPLSEREIVPQVMADALSVREQPNQLLAETLVDALRDKEMLLVLDNCEHLVDVVAPLVDSLFASCPRLRVLATSREPLGVEGEVLWQMPSLPVPDTDRLPAAEEITRYDAIRLFLDRARMRLPDFDLTPENGRAVAEICTKLDGIPLAIELATARVRTLAVAQISERLEDSLGLLAADSRTATPRQRTMRATLEWSHGLLPKSEKKLFERLSVFAGGFMLEAAEGVGTGGGIEEGDVLDLLGKLVDKSLVMAETTQGDWVRYRMLEPVRQYAWEKLEKSGEADTVRSCHAAFFVALAEEAEPEVKGALQLMWLERLEREHDNLRAALSWALERTEAQLALRLSGALGGFWYTRGHLNEGRRWLEAALANEDAPKIAQVKALAVAGWLAWEQSDFERSIELSEEGLALARQLEDKVGIAATLFNLGTVKMLQGESEQAATLFEKTLPLFRELGDKRGLSWSIFGLGIVAGTKRDYGQAKALAQESLALSRESGDVYSIALVLSNLGLMAVHQEEYGRAEALCKESLEISRGPGMVHVVAFSIQVLAALAGARGQPVRSARLWGAGEALRETIGAIHSPEERRQYEPYITAAHAQMDEAAWEAVWAEGKAMAPERAVQYALSEEAPAPPTTRAPEAPPSSTQPIALSRREEEVALLVARGLTNRQIAAEISVSEHTVANHVAKILRKLSLNSRSQVAAWAVEQRLHP